MGSDDNIQSHPSWYLFRLLKLLRNESIDGYGGIAAILAGASIGISESWRVRTYTSVIAGNSKLLGVPIGREFQILDIFVTYTSQAGGAVRQLSVQALDALGGLLYGIARAGVTQAGGLTRYYVFSPSVADLLVFRDGDFLTTPIPPTTFLQNWQQLRVWDNKNVNVLDVLNLTVQYAERTV